jgi:L-ascorbate metabolism protein UlaG (beta-lactamase superfamily)
MKQVPEVTYIGHATLLLEVDGVRILTDPLLRNQVTFLSRYAPPAEPAQYKNLDAVLISHMHYDHLDFPSLRMLEAIPRLIVPAGAAAFLRKYGFTQYEEVQVGDQVSVGSLNVRATPADHYRRRGPFGIQAECLGYVMQGSVSIYFPGDTRYFPGMADIAHNLDLALMPVWGWGLSAGRMHLNPRQAAHALSILRPRMAIPIHWGTYAPIGSRWLQPPYLTFPPVDFASLAKEYAPQVKVHILEPGEKITIEADHKL